MLMERDRRRHNGRLHKQTSICVSPRKKVYSAHVCTETEAGAGWGKVRMGAVSCIPETISDIIEEE